MKRTAVFMGAGASKAFGFPLTSQIFPLIREELHKGELFRGDVFNSEAVNKDNKLELRGFLNALLPGFKNQSLRLPLITDVLSLIDYSLLVSNSPLPRRSNQSLVRFRTLLEHAIFEVLDWPYDPDELYTIPQSLIRFARWVDAHAENGDRSVGLISTNYDIAIEMLLFILYRQEIEAKFDFGFSWRDAFKDEIYQRPATPSFHLYKLHGSLNWLRCELCERIYINTWHVVAHQAFRKKIDDDNSCWCDHAPLRSVLVAPSLIRDVRDVNLLEIWKNALELLRTAAEWIIIGYSFPPEDIAIRSLFIRAYQGRSSKPHIRVIQKDKDQTILSRYRLFFPNCDYETDGLTSFLSEDAGSSKGFRKRLEAAFERHQKEIKKR